ncbi:hypothetical protein PMIN06_001689 [Paraphaeosphaeria minitans]
MQRRRHASKVRPPKTNWMPRILNYHAIGYHAQSELGHGSNVKGLEMEARWDSVA